MSILQRSPQNPILLPSQDHDWEDFAVFNGTVIKESDIYHLLYRAMGKEKVYNGKKMQLSIIGKATSKDGVSFDDRVAFIKPEYEWEQYGCEDPRITKIDNKFFIFYTALSHYPPSAGSIKCAVAISHDLKHISEKHLVTPFNAKAMVMFPEKINGKYTVLLTVNTDNPPSNICIAQFEELETLWDKQFWQDWYENLTDHIINLKRINSDQVEVGAAPLKTKYGWILLYSYIKNYFTDNKTFRIEASLLEADNPQKIVGRIEEPCLVPQEFYEFNGQIKNVVFPSGALIEDNTIKLYYGAADNYCCLATGKYDFFLQNINLNNAEAIKCKRFNNNPLLEPIKEHEWESKGVFNPTVVELNNKIYIIYRALSSKDVSTFGCAISNDGLFIDERLPEPIYIPRTKWELSPTKTNCGCEDPRITQIDNMLYMCYTAYDGGLPRLALTSITVENFLKRNWSKWSEPKIISPPNIGDKDACLFPEKINGKYVFFHRIEPNIIIDFVDDLNFKDGKTLDIHKTIYPGAKFWDGLKIGINTTPIKTQFGWLVFYHAISNIDKHYRVGAILLDLNNPTKVIARTAYPILEPETPFEKDGIVNNVVFPCGVVQKNDELYLYYGAADHVVCGAKINIRVLLEYLLNINNKKFIDPSI